MTSSRESSSRPQNNALDMLFLSLPVAQQVLLLQFFRLTKDEDPHHVEAALAMLALSAIDRRVKNYEAGMKDTTTVLATDEATFAQRQEHLRGKLKLLSRQLRDSAHHLHFLRVFFRFCRRSTPITILLTSIFTITLMICGYNVGYLLTLQHSCSEAEQTYKTQLIARARSEHNDEAVALLERFTPLEFRVQDFLHSLFAW